MKISRVLCAMLCMLFLFSSAAVNASAADTAEIPSVTIKYTPGKCSFDFYKVTDYAEESGHTLTSVFAVYAESTSLLNQISTLDAQDLRTLASTLETTVKQNLVKPLYEADTDENGELTLSGVEKGIYLLVGEQTTDGTYTYTPSPIFISVPAVYSETGVQYNITVKHSKYEKEEVKNYVSRKVLKIWNDGGSEENRPKNITVQLLKDSEVYDMVVLSIENNWTHEWTLLPGGHNWKIAEADVPDGYKMSVEKSGNTFVITNTFGKDSSGDNDGDEPIISTGQLWWPVPVLALAGISFVIMGLAKRKDQYDS